MLILDEPTSNLDPTARSEVLAIVAEAKTAGRTVLFSSHVLSEVEDTCDRVAILRRGEVVHEQMMHELRRQHRIQARLAGPLPPPPAQFNGALRISQSADNEVVIETPGELAPLLGWLSTMPLTEVRIEPVRLESIYEQFHGMGRVREESYWHRRPFEMLSPSLYTSVMAVFNLRSEGRFVEPIDVRDLPESFALRRTGDGGNSAAAARKLEAPGKR